MVWLQSIASVYESDSDSSDPDIYYLHKQLLVGVTFLNSSRNFYKLSRKHSEKVPCLS